jgi:hypothetical protein
MEVPLVDLALLLTNSKKAVARNAPEILTAVGVSGVVATAYLSARGALKAQDRLRKDENANPLFDETDLRERKIRRFKIVAACYGPAVLSGSVAIVAIVGASRTNASRTAAAVAVASMTEKAFAEYREAIIEEIGETKEEKIRTELAQKRVNETPLPPTVLVGGNANGVLCRDHLSGRYFRSNMEAIRRAENKINHKIVHELYVTVDEYYDLIGLDHTGISGHIGWDSDRLLEFYITAVMGPVEHGEEPCLEVEFNYTKPI